MKWTFGCFLITSGIISTSKSTPFLKVILHKTTMLILSTGNILVLSGVNLDVSTALGIT